MQISNASFEAWRFMLIIGMDIMANNNDKATGYQKGKVRQKIYLNPPHYDKYIFPASPRIPDCWLYCCMRGYFMYR